MMIRPARVAVQVGVFIIISVDSARLEHIWTVITSAKVILSLLKSKSSSSNRIF